MQLLLIQINQLHAVTMLMMYHVPREDLSLLMSVCIALVLLIQNVVLTSFTVMMPPKVYSRLIDLIQ